MIKEVTPQIAALYLGRVADVEVLTYCPPFVVGDVFESTLNPVTLNKASYGEVKITPHLRRLSSMTEAEAREAYFIQNGKEWNPREFLNDEDSDRDCLTYWWDMEDEYLVSELSYCVGRPTVWLYLLGKGFDLFGLIDAGLAKEVSGTDIAG